MTSSLPAIEPAPADWYRTAFGRAYLDIYRHRDDREARETVRLIGTCAHLGPGVRVLDAPCGAGRHARQFSRAGCTVVGLDLSRPLLESAVRHRAPRPAYVAADLRAIPAAARSFDVVANLFSSLGYFESEADNAQVVAELARCCRARGMLVVDYFHAEQTLAHLKPESRRTTPEGLEVLERRQFVAESRRLVKCVDVRRAGRRVHRHVESVRLYEPEELRALLAATGVRVVRTFGGYDGRPFTAQAPRLILMGKVQP